MRQMSLDVLRICLKGTPAEPYFQESVLAARPEKLSDLVKVFRMIGADARAVDDWLEEHKDSSLIGGRKFSRELTQGELVAVMESSFDQDNEIPLELEALSPAQKNHFAFTCLKHYLNIFLQELSERMKLKAGEVPL